MREFKGSVDAREGDGAAGLGGPVITITAKKPANSPVGAAHQNMTSSFGKAVF